MRLGGRTSLVLLGALCLLTLSFTGVVRMLLWPAFERIEEREVRQAVGRSFDALSHRSYALGERLRDWAAWDDTYHYVLDRNEEYERVNLVPASMDSLNIDLLCIVDMDGNVVHGARRAVDENSTALAPLPDGFESWIRPGSAIMTHESLGKSRHGLIMLPEGPMLVGSGLITTTQLDKPAVGVIVFGIWLDEKFRGELRSMTHLEINFETVSHDSGGPAAGRTLEATSDASSWFINDVYAQVQNLDDDTAQGTSIISDISGRPALTMHVDVPRRVTGVARTAVTALLAAALASAAIMFSLVRAIMGKLVVERLENLSVEVSEIARGGDFSRRVNVPGTDELATLAKGVNAMLDSLEEARRAERQANRAKSLFLANMSHEIRTPMTAILGFTDVLVDERTSPSERLNAAQTVHRNGQHLLGLINDVLDVSKIEAGKLTLENVQCEWLALVQDAITLLSSKAREKDIRLTGRVEGAVPRRITTDPTRLRQALINLVGNAVKFTQSGGVHVEASFDELSHQVIIRVRDTGIGMTHEQIAGLFRPFVQAEESTTRRFGGTGLGLAITKHIAERLGGSLSVESTPGSGSTFTLRVGAGSTDTGDRAHELPENAADATRNALTAAEEITLSGRILLVEDGIDNQRLIRLILKKAGAEVEIVNNGAEGVDKAMEALRAGTPFDLILMDMQMPVMDGYTATSKLRSLGYRGQIIALTAHALREEVDKCLACGCDAFQTKPVKRAEFLKEVAGRMGRQSDHIARPHAA